MSAVADPLRRVAEERGHLMGELGVRPEDLGWARSEAEAIASLTRPAWRIRVPTSLWRLLRRIRRVVG